MRFWTNYGCSIWATFGFARGHSARGVVLVGEKRWWVYHLWHCAQASGARLATL